MGYNALHGGSDCCKKFQGGGAQSRSISHVTPALPPRGQKYHTLYYHVELPGIPSITMRGDHHNVIKLQMANFVYKKQIKSYFSRKENCAQVARLHKQSATETNPAQGLHGADSLRSRVPGKRKNSLAISLCSCLPMYAFTV